MTMTLRLYLTVHKQPHRLRHASPPTLAERWLEGAYLLKRKKKLYTRSRTLSPNL